jgi:hypothetical protein
MNLSVFVVEINAVEEFFCVQFPELQAFHGPEFGQFSRSDPRLSGNRPKFDRKLKKWVCALADFAIVNAFLCSLSGASLYIGSRSAHSVETQTPSCFEEEASSILAAAEIERKEALLREQMGPMPRLAREQQIYKQNPQKWIAMRAERAAESDRLYPPRRREQPRNP